METGIAEQVSDELENNPSDTCSLLFWYKKDGYWENWLMECENAVKND